MSRRQLTRLVPLLRQLHVRFPGRQDVTENLNTAERLLGEVLLREGLGHERA